MQKRKTNLFLLSVFLSIIIFATIAYTDTAYTEEYDFKVVEFKSVWTDEKGVSRALFELRKFMLGNMKIKDEFIVLRKGKPIGILSITDIREINSYGIFTPQTYENKISLNKDDIIVIPYRKIASKKKRASVNVTVENEAIVLFNICNAKDCFVIIDKGSEEGILDKKQGLIYKQQALIGTFDPMMMGRKISYGIFMHEDNVKSIASFGDIVKFSRYVKPLFTIEDLYK